MIRHVVSWKLAAEDSATKLEHATQIAERLTALVSVIPEIQELRVGTNAVGIEGNWDVVLIADYADEAALNAYVVHPAHQEVVSYVRSVVSARSAVDFEL
jgi:hypothetical protein